ncbi:small subunit ribosomal protein S10e [Nematocida parisii]|uniref:Plectin/eS10 N-terminal domain-containing protein n=1 Tax=Nematocida parisii (strain ERTm3) TaxID=935791 RepID=I3EJZ7_NEMP3|nr:uncharacterized protein NEPG_00926 [Nematocida parisii ERTm1]EIJ89544.1 hypothetical protein NEQG_00314 [Nematocida parisii ERTm3]KAI5127516.1 small subunit ribosomal protein S10e [Nematocida parisii]KAI5167329.1 small subunit ribosomal protein S10e [Nematocida sp. AWRm79]KAI5184706.1 small subunit ribosomal protein S10e [Nematocida sp. AWRm78]OAG31047.1 small subunit ribosomal protein S10e [Nematocida sp. ERTm5]|eukprot:XP_013058755.1 hypothetical protein NEPG_00926 [Nematocida parisii ERTm1]
MHIPTNEIKEVQRFIFDKGCIVVQFNRSLKPHPYVNVANFKVMKIVRSLYSKGCVEKVFAWRDGYYVINKKGIEYIRRKHYLTENDYPSLYDSDPLAVNKTVEPEEEGEIIFKE